MPKKKPTTKPTKSTKRSKRRQPAPRSYPADEPPRSSIYRGVTWCKATSRWIAQATVGGSHQFLGHFISETAAAGAYNSAVLNYLQEHDRLHPGQTLFDIGRVAVRMNNVGAQELTQKLQTLADVPEGLTFTPLD